MAVKHGGGGGSFKTDKYSAAGLGQNNAWQRKAEMKMVPIEPEKKMKVERKMVPFKKTKKK